MENPSGVIMSSSTSSKGTTENERGWCDQANFLRIVQEEIFTEDGRETIEAADQRSSGNRSKQPKLE
jgi:hypothetical protein